MGSVVRSDATPAVPARYVILGVLGQGAMGTVYRARDTQLDREVAVKVISASEVPRHGADRVVSVERFVREARAAARLAHPNIVAVHDVDPEAGWLVMALVDGRALKDVALPLPPADVRRIAEQVLSALAAAHAAGVVHRDIKPANIIVDERLHVTLIDFGIARLTDAPMLQTGDSVGTPAYMSPEQLRGGTIDARTDLYALGATLCELVTGERMVAFESPSEAALERMRQACGDQVGLARVIAHCLRGVPDERPASAATALAALGGPGTGHGARSPQQKEATTMGRRRWRRQVTAVALVAVMLVAAGGAALYLAPRRPARDPRLDAAFELTQRGEHERAGQLLDDLLGRRPDDPDALVLRVLTAWWDGTSFEPWLARALAAPVSKQQRAMLHGLELTVSNRSAEGLLFLAGADREMPDSPEISYLLGEVQFHNQRIDEGVATLERTFRSAPRWRIALHHVIDRKLMLGDVGTLRALATTLAPVDAAAAATLTCRIALAERRYDEAISSARAMLAREDKVAELHICLTQATTLAERFDAAAEAARRAVELWPVDLREWGGFAHSAEQHLYRGRLEDFLALLGDRSSRQRDLTLALWQPTGEFPARDQGRAAQTPLGGAVAILTERLRGKPLDLTSIREPEVRLYGKGLYAELSGDLAAASALYREALAQPSVGDVAMLLSHHLARTLHASGDREGATQACEGVVAPRVYHAYRAILYPDCVLWSGVDRDRDARLIAAWQGSTFSHPAVEAVRRRHAEPAGAPRRE